MADADQAEAYIGRIEGLASALDTLIAESRERELVESYRKAILSAFSDVETALAALMRTLAE